MTGLWAACEWCGMDFDVRHPGKVYCSTSCRNKAKYQRRQGLRGPSPEPPPVHLRDMSPAEIAWCAGLFEGEGAIRKHTLRRPGERTYYYVGLCVVSTDRDVLERLKQITGIGSILQRKRYALHHKTAYEWSTSGRAALFLLDIWWEWLSARRRGRAQELADECGRVLVRAK